MPHLYPLLGVSSPFDPSHRFTTSWLLPPFLLASIRLLFSAYIFLSLFIIFGWNGTHDLARASRKSFSYFTNLTYWGLAFYMLFSALHTFRYARTGQSWLQSWPRPLQTAYAIFYSTVVTFPFLVTIVYWAILYSDPWFSVVFDAWTDISRHAFNSFFALFEILIPRTSPPPLLHLPFLLILLALYLALAYLTQASQGFYPYDFLHPNRGHGRLAGYVLGILAAVCVLFVVVWCLIWGRRRLTEQVWRMEGKFSSRVKKAGDVEMREEIK